MISTVIPRPALLDEALVHPEDEVCVMIYKYLSLSQLRCILQFYYRTYQLHAYTDSLIKQVILLDALKQTILLNASLLALLSEFYFLLYKQRNPSLMLPNIARSTIANDSTVEPRLTTTSLIRPPRYYDHFFLARQNAHTFSYKNTPLMRPPRLCDQRPLF